jgi:hypothetical protein
MGGSPSPDSSEAFLLLLARRIVPESERMSEDEKARFASIVRAALEDRPPSLRRQFGLFLTVLRWLPALRYLGPYDSLSPSHQDAALRWFQDAPIDLLRKGFWGLKTLVFMGYYGQPELGKKLGYRPAKNGNQFLHAAH